MIYLLKLSREVDIRQALHAGGRMVGYSNFTAGHYIMDPNGKLWKLKGLHKEFFISYAAQSGRQITSAVDVEDEVYSAGYLRLSVFGHGRFMSMGIDGKPNSKQKDEISFMVQLKHMLPGTVSADFDLSFLRDAYKAEINKDWYGSDERRRSVATAIKQDLQRQPHNVISDVGGQRVSRVGQGSFWILPDGAVYKVRSHAEMMDEFDVSIEFMIQTLGWVRVNCWQRSIGFDYKHSKLTAQQRNAMKDAVHANAIFSANSIGIDNGGGGLTAVDRMLRWLTKAAPTKSLEQGIRDVGQKVSSVTTGSYWIIPNGNIYKVASHMLSAGDLGMESEDLIYDHGWVRVTSWRKDIVFECTISKLSGSQRSTMKDAVTSKQIFTQDHVRIASYTSGRAAEDRLERWLVKSDDGMLSLILKSPDAKEFWKRIRWGRAWYNPEYWDKDWASIPIRGRKSLSRMMNSQQNYTNKHPPKDSTSRREWVGFTVRRDAGKQRGDPEGHYTLSEAVRIKNPRGKTGVLPSKRRRDMERNVVRESPNDPDRPRKQSRSEKRRKRIKPAKVQFRPADKPKEPVAVFAKAFAAIIP